MQFHDWVLRMSPLWVSRTGSASDWCALQEELYKCIDTIQYNVIRHFDRLVDSCVVSTDIFVFRQEFAQWLPKCCSFWNWVSVHDFFAELARDFSRLKGVCSLAI